MATFTVRHGIGDDARAMFAGIARAWSRMVAGRFAITMRETLGIVGYVRAIEATYGPNGWHPHIHAIFIVRDLEACVRGRDIIADHWRKIVRRVLGPSFEPDDAHGVDLRPADVGSYIAKLGFEVAGAGKSASPGHLTPWDIARKVAETNGADEKARDLWAEWQRATFGRKQLTWSRGARDVLGRPEKTDAECASEPQSRDDVVLATFAPSEWRALVGSTAILLDAAETGGRDAVQAIARAILRAHEQTRRRETHPWAHWMYRCPR
jgi:hypothetical protein